MHMEAYLCATQKGYDTRTHALRSRFIQALLFCTLFLTAWRPSAMSVLLPTMRVEELPESAEKYRIPGLVRVPLDQIGFWPGQRYGLGCIPFHVHEVAADIVTTGTSLDRYDRVELVKIPAAELDLVRKGNKTMCDSVKSMPLFNADMVYVLLTKTHFTLAHMLIRDGGRTLHDYKMGTRVRDIKLLLGDLEGHVIQERGVLASIFNENLFLEPEAMRSYQQQDNMMHVGRAALSST